MAQKPVLISIRNADVASGSGISEDPVVSANGRFVAFESFAFNIFPGDSNGRKDVFYRDLQTGITTLVSMNLAGTGGGNGDSLNPAISADGRYVTYESRAGNLDVSEATSTATFGVTRTGNSSGALTVQYATSNGTATPAAEVFLLFDLVSAKPCACQYRFDIRNHLRVTTGVCDREDMIKPKPVGVLAQNILNATGFTFPTWFCPGPADGWYVRQPTCP